MPPQDAPIQRFPQAYRLRAARAAALLLAGLLAACGARRDPSGQAPAARESGGEAAYHPPPEATSSQRLAGGAVELGGSSEPGTRVRLASPGGTLTPALVSANGAWRARLPASDAVRLFGLAAIERGRTVQSEGYLAVTPGGLSAQLRAGAGARVIGARGALRILSVDFDRKGGVVVSGIGAPGANISLTADGAARGRALVDPDGRFTFPFDEPLTPGAHTLDAVDGAARSRTSVTLTPPAPLTAGPYRAAREADGWRIDWLTPGGGAQATLLLNSEEPAT
jgi:hypothetical protein